MKYPDSYLSATNELEVDFTPSIRRKAEAEKLSSKDANNLPDSDFAYISPGGEKDSEGKTTPRSLRHLPIPDAAHVRNALARINQTDIPPAAKKEALSKIKSKAKELGVEVSKSDVASDKSDGASDKQKAAKEKFLEMINKKKGGDKKDSDKKPEDKKSSKKGTKKEKKADAAEFPEVAFKPAPFDGILESAPYSKLLEPVDWDELKKELNLNNLWFKKPKAPKTDYRKFLDPNYTP